MSFQKNLSLFGFYFLFSIVWSWPLVLSPASSTVSLHFDQLPAAWLVQAAPDFLDGISQNTAWPMGEPLKRLDSFLFLLVALGLQGLVPGLLLTNLFVLLGPVFSAMAADRLAATVLEKEGWHARLSGLAFGFAPLATVGVLEGHCYYLLDPWLPLMALYLWRKEELKAAGCWLLALLTTAYLGINATLLALAVLLYRRQLPLRFLGLCGVAGLSYSLLFLGSGASIDRDPADALVRLGSASLTTLIAWTPWMDLSRHSLAPAIGMAPLCLAILGIRQAIPGKTLFLGLGLAAMLLSLGPVLEAGVVRDSVMPTPLYPLLSLGFFDTFRFPIRFAWLSSLCFGLVAAGVAAQAKATWKQLVFLAMVGFDCIVISGGIFRIRLHPAPIPSLYKALPQGALLELYPEVGGAQEDMSFYQQNLSCYYQTSHKRPIFDLCLNTDIEASPRRAAARELHHLLLDFEGSAREFANQNQLASIVLHADLYQPGERAELSTALTTVFGPPIQESTDGGEWLIAWKTGTLPKR